MSWLVRPNHTLVNLRLHEGFFSKLARSVLRHIRVGSVSTCASWRIPVVVGYAATRLRGMKRDAVPGMSINGRHASV
jgi:hypothetical protein